MSKKLSFAQTYKIDNSTTESPAKMNEGGEFFVLEVKPNVNMEEYEFNYDSNSNHLTWVRNKITNSDVMFQNMELLEM